MIKNLQLGQESYGLELVTDSSTLSRREQEAITEKYIKEYVFSHEGKLRREYDNKYLAFSFNEGVVDSDKNFGELMKRILQMHGKVLPVHSKPGKLVIIRHIDNVLNLGGIRRL